MFVDCTSNFNYDLIFMKCIKTRLDASAAPDTGSSNATNRVQMEAMGDLRSSLTDLSAHIVTREVRKDQPVLRVLFHAGPSHSKRNKVCILVSVVLNNNTVEGMYLFLSTKVRFCYTKISCMKNSNCIYCAIFYVLATMSVNLSFINLITFSIQKLFLSIQNVN